MMVQGFPPSPENQVTLANWRRPPFNKWAFSHVREIVPSATIRRAGDRFFALEEEMQDFSSLSIEYQGRLRSWQDFIKATDTDSLVILAKGKIIYEYYQSGIDATTPHILMSVSKSVLGLIFGILVEQGVLNSEHYVCDWIPELQDTAYSQATLRDLLDMRAGVKFDEDYQATQGAIIAYRKAQGWDPIEPHEKPDNLRSFFSQLNETDGQHGGLFHYVSPNTDLLGWVIERACGERYADVASRLLWQPMEAEEDAYITVDRLGAPRCAGGQCTTARDLARLGLLLARGGQCNNKQIIPEAWLADILRPPNLKDLREAWDGGDFRPFFGDLPIHYRSKWYVWHGTHKILFGFGVFGQNLFVDLDSGVVMAKFSSQPLAVDPAIMGLTLAAAQAVGQHF